MNKRRLTTASSSERTRSSSWTSDTFAWISSTVILLCKKNKKKKQMTAVWVVFLVSCFLLLHLKNTVCQAPVNLKSLFNKKLIMHKYIWAWNELDESPSGRSVNPSSHAGMLTNCYLSICIPHSLKHILDLALFVNVMPWTRRGLHRCS